MVRNRCQPIDILRGLTILWITAYHFHVDTRGGSGIATPAAFADAFGAQHWGAMLDIAARTLIALPSYRLDVLLFVTGVVLMLSRSTEPLAFWRRRARAIMPNYWLGTLAAALVLVLLALLRSSLKGTDLGAEIHGGTLLARVPYRFEWVDLPLSLSVAGRLATTRTMQVVAPSLWYVLLILQFYVVFPFLRRLLERIGPIAFLAVCAAVMCGGRALVFAGVTWPGFDQNGTLLYFVPFRLFGPALGMVMARWVPTASAPPRRWISRALLAPALAVLVWSMWIGAEANQFALTGAVFPLLAGLPALWVIASGVLHSTRATAFFTWMGSHSLSLLVAQDLLRLVTGTVMSIWGRLDPLTWFLMPVYLALVIALTPVWHAVPAAALASVEGLRQRFAPRAPEQRKAG